MAAPTIGRQRRWAPNITARVDRSNPIAAGLVGCWLPTGGRSFVDVITGIESIPTNDTAHDPMITPWGRATTQPCREPPGRPAGSLGVTSGCTITMAFVPWELTRSPACVFGLEIDSGPSFFARFGDAAANRLEFITDNDDKTDSATAFVVGTPYVVSCVGTGSTRQVWMNGRLDFSNTVAKSQTIGVISNSGMGIGLIAGTDFQAGSRWGTIGLQLALWHRRALSPAEIQRLYADPFCVLRM